MRKDAKPEEERIVESTESSHFYLNTRSEHCKKNTYAPLLTSRDSYI